MFWWSALSFYFGIQDDLFGGKEVNLHKASEKNNSERR
jgi:hypothetical protein